MCRHLAYLGAPATLRSVIIDPPHGLYKQAWAPRFQRCGAINADGFGVGWYPAANLELANLEPASLELANLEPASLEPANLEPARYRQAVPIWADESFADVARVTLSGAMLAAVRNATPGTSHGPAANAPFRHGRWLFSQNGAVDGWPGSTARLAAALPTVSLLELEARVDSALVWALVLHRLRRGLAPAQALADTAEAVRAAGVTGRFNLLLTDGQVIAGTTAGHTLYYRRGPGSKESVTVASEPGDDEPGWIEIPQGSLVTATPGEISVTPLPALDAIVTGRPADETPPDGRIATVDIT